MTGTNHVAGSSSGTRGRVIGEGVLASKGFVARYCAGINDSNRTAQAPHLPNHAAWCLGHLAVTLHRAAEKIDGVGPPESDFVLSGAGTRDGARFNAESVSFGSSPVGDAGAYPAWGRCVEVFERACDRFAAAVAACSDEKLDQVVTWGSGPITLGALGFRMVFHNGFHTGQIADLRRALGLGSVFKT